MSVSLENLDQIVERFPVFFKYRNATVGAVFDEFFEGPRPKAACSSISPYIGLPPSRLAWFTFSQLSSVLIDGGSSTAGKLPEAGRRFRDRARAKRRRARGRRAGQPHSRRRRARPGIRLADARRCVPGRDLERRRSQTLEELVGVERLPTGFVRRLQRMEPSFRRSSSTRRPASTCASTTPRMRRSSTSAGITRTPTATSSRVVPAGCGQRADARGTLARTGRRAPRDPRVARPYEIGRTVARARGLRRQDADRLRQGPLSGPAGQPHLHGDSDTVHARELHAQPPRAMYGWAVTPNQSGAKRLAHDTPIEGLSCLDAGRTRARPRSGSSSPAS